MFRTPTPALQAELIGLIRRGFPGHHGTLTAVVEFHFRRWRHRDSCQIATLWTPDNGDSGQCIWTRPNRSRRSRSQQLISSRDCRRLESILFRLEESGIFRNYLDTEYLWLDCRVQWAWMDREPDAYPGLERLVLTITPPSSARPCSPAR